jgi:hypothetical protein
MENEKDHIQTVEILMTVKSDRISSFTQLLGQGFTIGARVGCTVMEFLCNLPGLDFNYIEQRVQTIFLNGKPVDDLNSAVILDGATLALSAAMPGLAGAILRRGGSYASMRHQISYKKELISDSVREGCVVLKLFNLVARELGPIFLNHGICVSGENLSGFFRKMPEDFWSGCRKVKKDGQTLEVNKLMQMDWQTENVLLKVHSR